MGMFRYHKVSLTQTVKTDIVVRKMTTIIETTQKMKDGAWAFDNRLLWSIFETFQLIASEYLLWLYLMAVEFYNFPPSQDQHFTVPNKKSRHVNERIDQKIRNGNESTQGSFPYLNLLQLFHTHPIT